jgi:hypothetical protein
MPPEPADARDFQRLRNVVGFRLGLDEVDEALHGQAVIVGGVAAADQFFGFAGCAPPQLEGELVADAGLAGDPGE